MVRQFFYRIFCGFFLGLSVFAPGFSGSVIAIILGVYQDLVRIASHPFTRWKKSVRFLLPLGIGAVISAVMFILAFKFLFNEHEKATYLLFVGLIAGNLPVIFAEVQKSGLQKLHWAAGIGAFAVALLFGFLTAGVGQASGAEDVTAGLLIWAFSGFAAGAIALVPGMSVSMILILLGVYGQLIFAAGDLLHMNFRYLIPLGLFGVCAIAGLILASRGIKALFDRFPGFANAAVFGFMAGSLIGVLVQSLRLHTPNFNWLFGGLMLAAGLAVSMLFVALGKTMNRAPAANQTPP